MEDNELDSMTKTRLQDRLRAMGEKTMGNKPDLIQRLLDHMQSSPLGSRNNRGDSRNEEEEEEQAGEEKTEEEEKQGEKRKKKRRRKITTKSPFKDRRRRIATAAMVNM